MTDDVDRDGYVLRNATLADLGEMTDLLAAAFGHDPDPAERDAEGLVFEPDRNHFLVRDGRVVANAGAYTRELTVPGAVLPAAHVTCVAVRPEHRRRGLLTRLMRHQLSVISEPLAVLQASEGRIYQRFGYGMAASRAGLSVQTRELSLGPLAPAATGELIAAEPATARAAVRQVFELVRRDRPGWPSRDDRWWDYVFADPKSRRSGATAKRLTLYSEAGRVTGYAIWRTRSSWDEAGPNGEVQVQEVTAATPEAYAALWRQVLTVDLTRQTLVPYAAVDEPLRFLVDEPRRLRMAVGDGLWLRLLDIPVALAERRYLAPVEVVLGITDPFLPENTGCYQLSVAADGTATCERTTAEPDLAADTGALAAAYLGGVSLARLADTGRVRELRSGALAGASAAFGWHRAPAPLDLF